LGPKYGKDMNRIRKLLEEFDSSVIARQVASGDTVKLDGFDLLPEEILVEQYPLEGYSVASEAGYAVAVSTEITEELRLEGKARELVHRIQNMRRSAEFNISDHITTYFQGNEEINKVIDVHAEYIRHETLSRELVKAVPAEGAYVEEQDMDGVDVTLGVKRET